MGGGEEIIAILILNIDISWRRVVSFHDGEVGWTPVPSVYESGGWTPDPVWAIKRREKSLIPAEIPSLSLVAIPTTLYPHHNQITKQSYQYWVCRLVKLSVYMKNIMI